MNGRPDYSTDSRASFEWQYLVSVAYMCQLHSTNWQYHSLPTQHKDVHKVIMSCERGRERAREKERERERERDVEREREGAGDWMRLACVCL